MSIFAKKKEAQPLGRNSFDLSQKRLFTASAGELLPCYCAEVLPGDKFRINVSDFLRTQTCNTAAYSRMKQYVHFFFVPFRLLSTKFSQYLMRSPRMDSTAFKPFGSDGTFARFRQEMSFPYYQTMVSLCKVKDAILSSDLGINSTLSDMLSDEGFQRQMSACSTLKLLDLLEYGIGDINYFRTNSFTKTDYDFAHQDTVNINQNSIIQTRANLFRLLAYNRIYQDFYRDSRFESFNSVYSNIDDLSNNTYTDLSNKYSVEMDNDIISLFTAGEFRLRYRNYPKDYFTSNDINPFSQDSLLNRLPYSYQHPSLSYLGSTTKGESINPQLDINGIIYNQNINLGLELPTAYISARTLRSLYALENWASRQAHARSQSYSDLVKAHFGLRVNDSLAGVQFLGGSSSPVVINENVSTASTETASLGSLSGVGKSTLNNDYIEFENKNNEHGLIMGIFSIAPEPDYNSWGIDRHNLKTLPEEFFTPEYDGLGYQSTNSVEFNNLGLLLKNPSLLSGNGTENYNTPFGFMPIYSEYRTKMDKVFCEFRSEQPLSYWVNPRRIANLPHVINSDIIKCHPYDIDSIFQVNWISKVITESYGDTIGAHVAFQFNDQFFINLEVSSKAIRHMSQDGVTV